MGEKEIREQIRNQIREFYSLKAKDSRFLPGKSKVQYSGDVADSDETIAIMDAVLDGWWGVAKNARSFETSFSEYLECKEALLTNSGSSANLIAVFSLLSQQFKNGLKKGDEVVTPAVTFPTTFNPLVMAGLKPVLLDIELGTYNMDADMIRDAVTDRTRLIMLPHTLGNPNEMDKIMELARERNIHVIEDSCDALGSTYKGRKMGTFGIYGTFSFYVAHQMTMGEGGAIVSNDPEAVMTARSIRDWGRACVCQVCKIALDRDYKCPLRFEPKDFPGMPNDYDKRYLYINMGFNLKPLELQAAMGLQQLKKLPDFVKARKKNFRMLYDMFSKYEEWFVLPESLPDADPAWFAFPLTVRDGAPFGRKDIVGWLESNNIESRLMFAGNIIRQPAYSEVDYRAVGELKNSDKVMKDTFFIGIYPGIDEVRMEYMLEKISEFMRRHV